MPIGIQTIGLFFLICFKEFVNPQINHFEYSPTQFLSEKVDLPPYRLSMDVTGTSPNYNPLTWALIASSNRTAQPPLLDSSVILSSICFLNILKPVVASLIPEPGKL